MARVQSGVGGGVEVRRQLVPGVAPHWRDDQVVHQVVHLCRAGRGALASDEEIGT